MDNVPVRVRPTHEQRPPAPGSDGGSIKLRKKGTKLMLPIIIGLVVLIGAAWIAVWAMRQFGSSAAIDHSTYQGVFVSSGQVYFGKLEKLNDGYWKLADAFYIKLSPANKSAEQGAEPEPNELIKYGTGDEQLYGPRDTVTINNDQVLYFVNMDENGKVVQAIKKYHDQQKK